ncbi:MAG: hypothetical protein IT215_07270 [Chitinophagaceae bacterium]|nr:hypothetical protein [Chitinophagaceae bacterium]HMN33703.1 hypothetical protein [Chitinophagaceae bacterium]
MVVLIYFFINRYLFHELSGVFTNNFIVFLTHFAIDVCKSGGYAALYW